MDLCQCICMIHDYDYCYGTFFILGKVLRHDSYDFFVCFGKDSWLAGSSVSLIPLSLSQLLVICMCRVWTFFLRARIDHARLQCKYTKHKHFLVCVTLMQLLLSFLSVGWLALTLHTTCLMGIVSTSTAWENERKLCSHLKNKYRIKKAFESCSWFNSIAHRLNVYAAWDTSCAVCMNRIWCRIHQSPIYRSYVRLSLLIVLCVIIHEL